MQKKLFIILSILAVILLAAGCSQQNKAADKAPLVKTLQVSINNSSNANKYPGTVHGRYESNLSFQVGGKILHRNVNIGDTVHAGDVLMLIDSKDVVQQVNKSDANVDAAHSNLSLAKSNLSRYKQLYSQNAVAKSTLDQYQNTYDSALSSYQQAVAQALEQHNSLSYTNLRANADGVITAINAEAGQVVSAGQTILTLVQSNELEVQANIPENQINNIAAGQHVTVSFWALSNISCDGIIREISPIADSSTRTYLVKISLPNPPNTLKLGMTANIIYKNNSTESAKNQYIIPLSAIYQTNNIPKVWIVNKDNTVSLKNVQVETFKDNYIKVSGINEGETIVTAGVQKLHEGEKVRISASAPGDNT